MFVDLKYVDKLWKLDFMLNWLWARKQRFFFILFSFMFFFSFIPIIYQACTPSHRNQGQQLALLFIFLLEFVGIGRWSTAFLPLMRTRLAAEDSSNAFILILQLWMFTRLLVMPLAELGSNGIRVWGIKRRERGNWFWRELVLVGWWRENWVFEVILLPSVS